MERRSRNVAEQQSLDGRAMVGGTDDEQVGLLALCDLVQRSRRRDIRNGLKAQLRATARGLPEELVAVLAQERFGVPL